MKILVALDDSPISVRAAREAVRLFPDGDFHVINVSRVVVPWITADYGTVYPLHLTELPVDGLTEDALAERAESAGIEAAELVLVEGDPAEMICAAADALDAEVVVIGSHDKGVLRRLMDPSVAHAVVQGTYRPVLVVSGEPPADGPHAD